MNADNPVVTINVRDNRDLVEHGKTGLLMELGDVNGFAIASKSFFRSRTAGGDGCGKI
ncbi:hypothetical protein [Desulfofundulus thermocisternus]|uniref:hypothetical protein n=1 Tax=Desulfofundulus thermocisternus TaxID=42471 RepID=UPI0012FF3222|nr:hypothetical protein [Desulfofundulus thermocisternus]